MADHVRISQQQQLTVRGSGAPNRTETLPGYGAGRDTQTPVAVTQPMASEEVQRAMSKLTKTLDSGNTLRQDVPRGFYLNIRV